MRLKTAIDSAETRVTWFRLNALLAKAVKLFELLIGQEFECDLAGRACHGHAKSIYRHSN